jgi:fluoroquinolone transport system ATP-binding protein
MDDVVIRVEDLSYAYPGRAAPAVDGMSFEVGRGEVFGFLGPSGAGKTTAQRILIGLLTARSGRIELLGREPRHWGGELYDRIGVAFELPVGYPRLTGREDLSHFAHLHAGPTRDVMELLAALGLDAVADEPVGSYSKGMRVRLNLARALLHEPELLFLDEPTSGLDPVNAAAVRELIRAEQRQGRTIFLTTHDMRTADDVCDRVAFVVDGRIAACDGPRAFRLRHGRPELRVEHRANGVVATSTFPLGGAPDELVALLSSGHVETVHTTEASLDEVFVAVTGQRL